MSERNPPARKNRPIIFFDGVCSVCNFSVDFILKRDPSVFLFAPLQGRSAQEKLKPEFRTENLKTIVLLDEEGVHVKSRAVLRIGIRLGGIWKLLWLLWWIPSSLLDLGYDFFAAHRYQWFGKRDTCRLPTPEERSRFLD